MFTIPEDYCQEVIKKFDAHQALPVEAYNRQFEKRFGHGFWWEWIIKSTRLPAL